MQINDATVNRNRNKSIKSSIVNKNVIYPQQHKRIFSGEKVCSLFSESTSCFFHFFSRQMVLFLNHSNKKMYIFQ